MLYTTFYVDTDHRPLIDVDDPRAWYRGREMSSHCWEHADEYAGLARDRVRDGTLRSRDTPSDPAGVACEHILAMAEEVGGDPLAHRYQAMVAQMEHPFIVSPCVTAWARIGAGANALS